MLWSQREMVSGVGFRNWFVFNAWKVLIENLESCCDVNPFAGMAWTCRWLSWLIALGLRPDDVLINGQLTLGSVFSKSGRLNVLISFQISKVPMLHRIRTRSLASTWTRTRCQNCCWLIWSWDGQLNQLPYYSSQVITNRYKETVSPCKIIIG